MNNMKLKDLDLAKLSKLTSEYIDEVKCIECCKYFIAPATATCGHTLCHTCWRGRRLCPICSTSLERKTLKLNLPLQNLTNHVQKVGETFEKLFNIKLDQFELDAPEALESEKDPVKNVKDWLTSSQNHFSAPIQHSESFSQDSQQPCNPLEVSTSKIIIHTDTKKDVSSPNIPEVVHIPQPQDDWDKIEPMPDTENIPKINENIIGPMDIEPFFVDDGEYTTDNPRRSSRKRDVKLDDSNQKIQNLSVNKHNSRDSSCETDKKSQKGKHTWTNVKRMRKEFSKLNKKNKNKLNVSIEMVKKTQNVKTNNRLDPSQHIVNIDENTPGNIDKETNINVVSHTDPSTSNQGHNIKENNDNHNIIKQADETKAITVLIPNDNEDYENQKITKNNVIKNKDSSKISQSTSMGQQDLNKESKMPFIKKSALCPRNIEVICDNIPNNSESVTGNSDDIEISIKIGNTITNIFIKKKNDIRVKINTDREVQTSLEPHNLDQNKVFSKDIPPSHDNDVIVKSSKNNNLETQMNVSKSATTQLTGLNVDKSTSGKKNTASADTGTAPPFEITDSVEKELSNVMEYETAEGKDEPPKSSNTVISKVQDNSPVPIDVDNIEDLNDLDIFNSGSVKEANVHLLKDHAPSEILISTAGSKLKTQRTEKRARENTGDDLLPKYKKVKVSQQKVITKCILPDSEPNYDDIMGQVFANIDADIEEVKKSQNTQNVKTATDKNSSPVQKTQIIKHTNQSNSEILTTNIQEYFNNEKHSENVFSILEKDEENVEENNKKVPEQVQEFLTPVCQNLDSSQESQDCLQKTNKTNKKTQDYDDSDKSIVEETPQKDLSITKLKRASTSNRSQISQSETRKIPSKASVQSVKSIINLTDTVTECNKTSRDMSVVETAAKKLTLETPLTITKFANHIIYKSTPVARKSLNFEQDDPEQTLCPTSEIAKTTQEKEILSKAFEMTPLTPSVKPLLSRNVASKVNKKYCLAASCLTSTEIAKVKILCTQKKWSYVDKYTKDITHLVVGVDEEMKSQRSVKYMSALAASKWIVSFDWINNCLRKKDTVEEEPFEALDNTGEPGPRRSRIATQKLFQGIKFYCMPPFSVLDVDTLKNMLLAAGGHVVKEMKDIKLLQDSSEPALLLAEPEHTQEDRFIYLAMEQSIVPVNYEWVLNCLGSYSLGSIQELLLCPSSLLPASTAMWPEVLLSQDYD